MSNKDDSDEHILEDRLAEFERWFSWQWDKQLRRANQALSDDIEAILVLLSGTVSAESAQAIRQKLNHSPSAVQDYARIAGVSQDEARAALATGSTADSESNAMAFTERILASAQRSLQATVHRVARLLISPSASSLATQSAGIRGNDDRDDRNEAGESDSIQTQVYRADEEAVRAATNIHASAVTISISASKVTVNGYAVIGAAVFDRDTEQMNADPENLNGHFVFSQHTDVYPDPIVGDIRSGEFDLGLVNRGVYRLELIFGPQVIEVTPLHIR